MFVNRIHILSPHMWPKCLLTFALAYVSNIYATFGSSSKKFSDNEIKSKNQLFTGDAKGRIIS